MNTSAYLDAVKERLNLQSDYALAAKLEESRSRISNYRTGRTEMDGDLIQKVASALGIDPIIVLADVSASRASTGFERDAFKRLAIIARAQKRPTAVAAAVRSEGGKTSRRKGRMVAKDGIEPPTRGFSIPCSTD